MIILEEKMPGLPPPPPYSPGRDAAPPPFPHSSRAAVTLGTLPPHLLLRIVYLTFTNGSSLEKQRKTLYWLTVSLRLVNRAFYVACMHVLRSTYIPAYASLVHPPYTSDPFPLQSSALYTAPKPADAPIQIRSLQRETQVLDLFIALKVREDVWLDETELHLERDESFRDLFDLNQPRARTEDLVRVYGMREGLISAGDDRRPANAASGSRSRYKAVPFDALSVTFSSRRLGLVLTTRERKRTVVEVQRTKDESLEAGAKRLVREMKLWLSGA